MPTYDFLLAKQVILSNVKPTSACFIFTFDQLFTWIGKYNDHIYDFLLAKQVILSNVRTDLNFTQFCF